MSKRGAGLAFAAALVAGVAVWLGGGGAARAETPRVAVAPVAGEKASPEVKERVGRSLAEGLLASGADVAASPSEAPYLLRGRVEVEGRSYTLHLELVDRRSGAVVASREDRCEICTEADAFETASAAASTLKAQAFKRQAGLPGPGSGGKPAVAGGPGGGSATGSPAAGAPAAPSIAAGGPPGTAPGVELRASPTPPARHRALGWAAVAAGVVGAGGGAVLWSLDGSGTCRGPGACPNLYDTRWGGAGLIGAGVVAVGVGVLAVLGKL